MNHRILAAAVVAFPLLASAPITAQTITELVPLPSGIQTFAYGVNADGTAVAGASREPQFILYIDRPTRWSVPSPGSATPLNLGILPGQGSSYALGVSDDGNVITGYSVSAIGRGFRWAQAPAPSPGLSDLNLLPGGAYLVGRQISGDGSTIVGWGDTTSNTPPYVSGPQHAFKWTMAGGGTFTPLGTFGGSSSYAIGVNYDGSVICGYANNDDGVVTAFRWQGGTKQNLGLLAGGTFSHGYAVSSDGSTVVGQANVGSGLTNTRAFRWKDGVMQNIGYIGPNSNGTYAYAVNGNGDAIVGESGYFKAMLWTEALGMVDLESHLASLGVDLTGWVLNDCRGITPDGRCLVGNGGNPQQRGWIVHVPYLQAPTVITNPVPQSVCAPADVTFTAKITAIGGGLLLKNWRHDGNSLVDGPTGNGSIISGADTDTLTIYSATPADAGLYDLVAFDFYNYAITNAAQLDVGNPVIGTFGPYDAESCAGGTAAFTVATIPFDSGPNTYQWRRGFGPNPVMTPLTDGPTGNGSVISGATTPWLFVAGANAADVATYDCVVTTAGCGTVYSTTAVLTVYPGGTGDGDLSGFTNGLDIPGFVNTVLYGGVPSPGYCAYDMNGDGVVDMDDLPGFLAALL